MLYKPSHTQRTLLSLSSSILTPDRHTGLSIKMYLNLDVDKINLNLNGIVWPPPALPASIVCLF